MAIAGLVLGYVGVAVLALVIVLVAVGATDTNSSASCRSDATVLGVTEEAYFSQNDVYGSESELLASGLLSRGSDLHNIRLVDGGADYELVGINGCG